VPPEEMIERALKENLVPAGRQIVLEAAGFG
jgi:hypothetical protein